MGVGMGMGVDSGQWTRAWTWAWEWIWIWVKNPSNGRSGRSVEGASGGKGVIQDGVGAVETCKSEAGSLIQQTSASRSVGTAKDLGPNKTCSTLRLQSDKTIAWHGHRTDLGSLAPVHLGGHRHGRCTCLSHRRPASRTRLPLACGVLLSRNTDRQTHTGDCC